MSLRFAGLVAQLGFSVLRAHRLISANQGGARLPDQARQIVEGRAFEANSHTLHCEAHHTAIWAEAHMSERGSAERHYRARRTILIVLFWLMTATHPFSFPLNHTPQALPRKAI
jgi:hypothetical protein